jgi:hypothetical protein
MNLTFNYFQERLLDEALTALLVVETAVIFVMSPLALTPGRGHELVRQVQVVTG